jgi:hypothetical protein
MKYFITFLFFLLTNCLVPTTVSAIVNIKNNLTHTRTTTPKKLSYKERVVVNFQKYKAKFNATFKEKLEKSLGWWITGAILLGLGLLMITSINRRNEKLLQQTGEVNRASGMAMAVAAVVFGFGVICLIIALVESI